MPMAVPILVGTRTAIADDLPISSMNNNLSIALNGTLARACAMVPIIYALGSASLWYDTTATYRDETINAS